MSLQKAVCWFSLIFLFASVPMLAGDDPSGKRAVSLDELETIFSDPPVDYRSVPFWSWNDKMTKKEISLQLEDFKAKGIGGVFMHPRYGLITEYLSDEWFEMVRYTIDKCRELGMEAWIYDENSYPSGFAGGHVPAEMPESFNQGQGLKMKQVSKISAEKVEKVFLALYRKEQGELAVLNPGQADEFKNKEGDYFLFEKEFHSPGKWYGGYSYVDLLVKGVTEKFLDVTMTGYENSAGSDLSGVVPGVFTDEPNIAVPNSREAVRWTPDLFDSFRDKWGYGLEENLPSLFEETGDWMKVRHNYQSVLLDLFIERWSKPCWEYTEKHGLKWTGHYWEHGWPSPRHGPDNMAMYAWHQMPAIDLLFNRFERQVQFGNVRNVKELSSVANQLDRHRTLSETYGGGGWELRFEDMKRLGDWQYVLGVNFLNQHLSHVSLKGDRKHDYPQSFTYHNPWWEYYRPLGDYYARLSAALSSGHQENRVLVLEPTTSGWMYAAPDNDNSGMKLVHESFTALTDELESMQCEYDLGCENIIRDHGKVTGNRFVVGEREYEVVVIPPYMANLDSSTFQMLALYLDQGGKIILLGEMPELVDGTVNKDLAGWSEKYKGRLTCADSAAGVASMILPEDFSLNAIQGGGLLYHHRRQLKDGQVIFLVNSSLEETSTGELLTRGASARAMDPFKGTFSSLEVSPADKQGYIRTSFNLPPAGSLLMFVSDTPGEKSSSGDTGEAVKVSANSNIKAVPSQPNMLTLDYCDLVIKGEKTEGIFFHKATDMIYQAHGFKDNPWNRSVQYKTEILDKGKFGPDTGFEAFFHFEVREGTDVSGFQAVVEQPGIWEVKVNGSRVVAEDGKWWLDRSFGVFGIGDYLKAGMNTISLQVAPMNILAELEPVYILGDFSLESREHGWQIAPAGELSTGSWKAQGMPFYSDKVSYVKTYDVDKSSGKKFRINLGAWSGTVAEVKVNGASAGIIGWKPYELDVTSSLKDGLNQVEVVIVGSLKNLLGPLHTPWQKEIVTIGDFQQGPDVQPEGVKYDTLDYGLMDDFDLFVLK